MEAGSVITAFVPHRWYTTFAYITPKGVERVMVLHHEDGPRFFDLSETEFEGELAYNDWLTDFGIDTWQKLLDLAHA